MKKPIFCTTGDHKSLFFARKCLDSWGYTVQREPTEKTTHLLLPVPTPADAIPHLLPENVTVLGGNLPELPCPAIDFLQDEYYLQENAAITADCAITIAQQHTDPAAASALVIGWGRIGKHLAHQLPHVTVAVRKEKDLQALRSQGISGVLLSQLDAREYDLIFNTAPAPVLQQADTKPSAVLIDLASKQGITGDRVLWARGLPGKLAPESAGLLIAKTALRYAL